MKVKVGIYKPKGKAITELKGYIGEALKWRDEGMTHDEPPHRNYCPFDPEDPIGSERLRDKSGQLVLVNEADIQFVD